MSDERADLPYVAYRDGDGARQVVELDPLGGALTIGRRDEADIRLPWDGEVSRLHAELAPRAGEWTIVDDGLSQNGTLVNELPLEGRRRLRDGDLIRIGQTLLEFRAPVLSGAITIAPGVPTSALTFSDLQQRLLAALCRPLRRPGATEPATDEVIAFEVDEPAEHIAAEIDRMVQTLGIGDLPPEERRGELALLAMRSGLVPADE